ncbi:hypothetical protein ACQ4PT_037891 [Festuca glaucescens]
MPGTQHKNTKEYMTVGDSGISGGDWDGDLATPSPARESSPEWLRGSRFWLLQASDEEEEEVAGGEESAPGADGLDLSIRYLCRTPSPASGIDIVDDASDLARRALKRIEKRNAQRMATKAAMALEVTEGTNSFSQLPLGKGSANNKQMVRLVMEPSLFTDDTDGGWTVVRWRHRPPVITGRIHEPNCVINSKISEKLGLGLAGLRASPTKLCVHGNSSVARNRFVIRARSNGAHEPRQARIGEGIAGHAFRKLLGFVWRKKEPGEPVWRRRALPSAMNGDGGGGGFNPGRGAFNAGRGGFQGRGGHQGRGYQGQGRGGFQGRASLQGRGIAVPRGRQGNARGGHRPYQGTADQPGLGRGADYVQGESSATGGRISDHQRQSWAGNYQRNNGYNAGNNGGYGGYQQRWQSDRGYQYRPRDNGANMQSRAGIDADLLQQTVQAVVAAVTAATKVTEPAQGVPSMTPLTGSKEQHTMTSVATPNAAPQPTLEVQQDQGAGAKTKDNDGQGPQKKKEEKSGCFRCKQPGHHIDDCPTPFCDLCESVHHATHACHIHQAPKPTAILHGYANEALMFFELAYGTFKAKVENPKLAKVTVDGDAMTIPELIDQLKKIVPSDKFNWEVFHFKENIYRVKLPIWVRVSGLPSDIRSDYLSLWGVGTLFGKTLDVDMAYTRRNKVLRTKIGCLDRSLIPKDCDMFIRRGFLKLYFEVEDVFGSQEVDMVDNGRDGNDDAPNGEHNKEGGNAMDMDPKGQDEPNTSNNGGQDGASINDGVQGMQLNAKNLGEINIGSIMVPLSPTGVSTLGFPQVASGLVSPGCSKSASSQSEQQLQAASNSARSADMRVGTTACRMGEPGPAACVRTTSTMTTAGSSAVAGAPMDVGGREISMQRIREHRSEPSGLIPLSATAEGTASPRFSVPVHPTLNAHAAPWPQKILTTTGQGTVSQQQNSANHWLIDGQSLATDDAVHGGSAAYSGCVAHGNICHTHSDFVKEKAGEKYQVEGKSKIDDQSRVEIASPQRVIGDD